MKFAFIADIHLSRYGQDKREETTGLPERLDSIKKALYEVADYCYDSDIDKIVIGGDLYHNKSIVYSIAQDIMFDFFEKYKVLEFIVIDGNHDLSGKGQNVVSSLRAISKCHNVNWVTQVPSTENDGLVCIPYSHDVVNQVKAKKGRILISHFGLSEGVLNSGMSIISDISVRDLIGKYELVLLGHYHKPQEIIHDGFKLYYVGSLIQLDWGEKNEDKRFIVVDTDTLDVSSIPISSYKRHIEVEVDNTNRAQALADIQKHYADGQHVKVILKERVDLGPLEVDVRVVDKTEVDITDRGITSSMSDVDIHRKYMEIKKVPQREQDDYLHAALEIIHDCEEK
jgi:DNA repair exonuclease SbcCD nuclease subunit